MKRLTLPIVAVATLVAGAPALEAQQSDGSWWRPGVLRIADGVVRYQAAGEGGWWWKDDPTDGRQAPRTEQQRDRDGGGGWWWEDDRDDGRYERTDGRYERYDPRYEERYETRGRNAKKGNGPPFCRNGQGHPVHGWDWCVRKGWAGDRYDRYERNDRRRSWDQAGWGDVIMRGPQPSRDRYMDQPSIADILGDVVFGRLVEQGRRSGYRGALDGRWVPAGDRGSIMQLRMGGRPLAELADVDRDGRADLVLLRRGG